MKTNVRNEDAITRAMGWLDQLREDGRAEPVFESGSEPATADGPPANATARPPNTASGGHEMRENVEIIERAPIGDALRIPIAWCEMDSCISHYGHPAALGEADIRARAIADGWRVDALSRLACPQCQRSVPWFRTTHPIVRWDRDRAVHAAALMAAAARDDASGGAGHRAGRGVIRAPEEALVPWPAQGRHREYLGDSGSAG
ncbi:MAG: hypothetical protein QOG05_1555 [Streptosporangiaceae bacterium]|jgi:hypothetical protein|nr:hypothetical protein [Streptosporangiaceae bacterium]